MANPTTNFGWVMPTSASLVTNLPADFNVFGQAVDTSMQYLLGGTTGQILSKTSGTNMAFTWIANDQGDITGVTAGTGISVSSPTGPVPTVSIDTAVTADLTTAQTLTNKKLSDSTTTIVDVTDATKAIKFDVAGTTGITGTIATAFTTAKTVTIPDTTGTVALTNGVVNNTLITTTGDIIYASAANTPARLGIGSASQVLTVASGIPSWATPASGGMTLITSATFSSVATVTIDSVFSSTYKSYQVYFEVVSASTAADDLQMQMRYGSTTQSGAVYLGSQFQYNRNNTLGTNGYASATTALILPSISTGGTPSLGTINFSQVGQSSQNASFYGNGLDGDVQAAAVFAGLVNTGQTYTGLLLKGSTANITGRYAVYGLAN